MASTSAAARESTKEPGLGAPSRSHGRHRGRSAKNPVTIHASTTAAPPPSSSSSQQDAERLKLAASFARNSRDSEEYAERLRSLGKELKTTEASAAGPVATQPPSMITPGRKVPVAKLQSGSAAGTVANTAVGSSQTLSANDATSASESQDHVAIAVPPTASPDESEFLFEGYSESFAGCWTFWRVMKWFQITMGVATLIYVPIVLNSFDGSCFPFASTWLAVHACFTGLQLGGAGTFLFTAPRTMQTYQQAQNRYKWMLRVHVLTRAFSIGGSIWQLVGIGSIGTGAASCDQGMSNPVYMTMVGTVIAHSCMIVLTGMMSQTIVTFAILSDTSDHLSQMSLQIQQQERHRLARQYFEALPNLIYGPEHASKGTECTICSTDFNQGERIKCLACNHQYHAMCIMTWLKQQNNCPLCRKPALPGMPTFPASEPLNDSSDQVADNVAYESTTRRSSSADISHGQESK